MDREKKIEAAFVQLLELAYRYKQTQDALDYGVSNYETRKNAHNARVEFDYFMKSMGVNEATNFQDLKINFHDNS